MRSAGFAFTILTYNYSSFEDDNLVAQSISLRFVINVLLWFLFLYLTIKPCFKRWVKNNKMIRNEPESNTDQFGEETVSLT